MAEKKSYWSTLPGLITGIAAIVTGLAALIPIVLGLTKSPNKHNPSGAPAATQSASPTPSGSSGSSDTGSPSPGDSGAAGSTESPSPTSSGAAALVASPSTEDWGQISVNSSPQERTVTFSNQGSSGITIDSVQITGPQASAFSISRTTCGNGTTVATGSTCEVAITYKPALGSQSASLVVNYHPPRASSTKVPLSGKGSLL